MPAPGAPLFGYLFQVTEALVALVLTGLALNPRTGILILYSSICPKSFFRSLTQNRGTLSSDFSGTTKKTGVSSYVKAPRLVFP